MIVDDHCIYQIRKRVPAMRGMSDKKIRQIIKQTCKNKSNFSKKLMVSEAYTNKQYGFQAIVIRGYKVKTCYPYNPDKTVKAI